MKFVKLFLFALILLGFVANSLAGDEEILKQKIISQLGKALSESKIQEPGKGIVTRSPAGPRLYRQVVDAVAFIATEEGNLGSGILISSKGLIITNWHVVKEQPMVGFVFKPAISWGKVGITEKDVLVAKVITTDRLRDLALLQLLSVPPTATSVQLANSSQIEIGQDVFAISHPEGLAWSYTEGVISQIRPKAEWTSNEGSTHRATLIQTQAVISLGSSGGPLFDYDGHLIGIIVSTKGPGLNFAIAVDEVQQFTLTALERR